MKSVYRQVMFVACQTALNFSLAVKFLSDSARWSMIFWDLEQSVATTKDSIRIQVTVSQ